MGVGENLKSLYLSQLLLAFLCSMKIDWFLAICYMLSVIFVFEDLEGVLHLGQSLRSVATHLVAAEVLERVIHFLMILKNQSK